MSGEVVSVNLGRKRLITLNGRPTPTGIFKEPVEGRVEIGSEGLAGDRIADLSVHGGVDKAVYSYACEDYAWWAEELGRECGPGLFGENLTLRGVEAGHAVIGERWRIGTTLLEVSEPRQPCSKLAAKMQDPGFVKRFAKALRLGAYLRVIEPGEVGAGDAVEIVERPAHGVTIELLGRVAFGDRRLAAKALEAPALSGPWREWLSSRVPSAS